MPWRAGVSPNSELYEVYVDGRREPTAFEASISQGWARFYVLDEDGENVALDGLGRERVCVVWGRVEIRKVNR
jgi:hypothetical protein